MPVVLLLGATGGSRPPTSIVIAVALVVLEKSSNPVTVAMFDDNEQVIDPLAGAVTPVTAHLVEQLVVLQSFVITITMLPPRGIP